MRLPLPLLTVLAVTLVTTGCVVSASAPPSRRLEAAVVSALPGPDAEPGPARTTP
ncbi:hypothetical protein ACIQB5_49865 [Streptomyces sp. NPDC088560]|uniref:hypothetical protein n=1 Tax=Streptomyces sp. NPDC088560 TaxID=3365868 RepID=UPI0037F933D2